jgi:hypothetical protein
VPKLVAFLLFLVFIEDSTCAYATRIGAPFGWLRPLLEPTPIKLRLFDLLMILVIFLSKGPKKPGPVVPMRSALYLILGTTVFTMIRGVATGGDFRFASWQTYLILSMVLTAFAVASACRTPAHYVMLGKWLIAASVYRAAMCWISYFTWAKALVGESGAFMTAHVDTIPWVTSILILIVNMFDKISLLKRLRNLSGILLFLGALQFNSRRLAWVSLIMGFVVAYSLLPKGRMKRRVNRIGLILSPVILAYVGIGWGRPEKIFLPLESLSSVSTKPDASTLARNAENLGLLATAHYNNSLFGTGWGHPYIYLTLKYDISGFELWRYVPHNSILGLLAFSGVLGFAGFWLAIPTSVFLNARVARLSPDPVARTVCLIGAAQLIVCCNQLYGDMGIFTPGSMYVIAVSYAIAMRIPPVAGAWGAPMMPPKPAAPQPRPTNAPAYAASPSARPSTEA